MRKDYNIKPKEQHKQVLDNLLEQKANGELLNKGKALKEAGYSETVAKKPGIVLDTKGFQSLLEDKLPNLTLIEYLSKDLETNDGNRLGYLKLAFELKGLTNDKVDVNVYQEVDKQLINLRNIIDKANEDE